MKFLKTITFALFVIGVFVAAASAQGRSIKSVTDKDLFHSDEHGFEIALPANMVKKETKSEAGRTNDSFTWEFSDGVVGIGVQTRDKAVKTDADVAAAVESYKSTVLKGDKILSESPASIGEYRGTSFVVEKDGNKAIIIVLAWEKFGISIVGMSISKSPEIQKLYLEAIQSFEFVSDK